MKFRILWVCVPCCFFSILVGAAGAEEIEDEKENVFAWLEQRHVELYGSLELEFHIDEEFEDPGEDSPTMTNWDASLDLGLALQPKSWLGGEFIVTWDEGGAIEIDEAWMTLGNPDLFLSYLSGGKLTLPFGRYETVMISDSLPQEIGETKEEAVLLGLEWQGLQLAVFAFDGSRESGDHRDGLSPLGADIRYRLGEEDTGLLVGASWIENLQNSDGLSDYISEEGLILTEEVPGVAVYSQLSLGALTLAAEYVESLKRPKIVEDGEVEKQDRQIAWAGELAVAFGLGEVELECGVTYGESSGLGELLPKKRFGGVVSFIPQDYLRLGVEYLRDEDYSVDQDGTGDHADLITFQLAAEF